MLEAAKFNVLTAHSTRESLDIFHLFPNVSVAVLVGEDGIDCEAVAKHIRSTTDKIPLIYITGRIAAKSTFADHTVANGEPETLLDLVRKLVGDPRGI